MRTPQVYVNGQGEVVGANGAQLNQLIAKTSIKGPLLSIAGSKVQIDNARAAPGDGLNRATRPMHGAGADPRWRERRADSAPPRHRPRAGADGQLERQAASYALSAPRDRYRTAVLVKSGKGGAIIGAAKGRRCLPMPAGEPQGNDGNSRASAVR